MYSDIRPIYLLLWVLLLSCQLASPIAWPFQERVPAHDDTSKSKVVAISEQL